MKSLQKIQSVKHDLHSILCHAVKINEQRFVPFDNSDFGIELIYLPFYHNNISTMHINSFIQVHII